MAKFMISFEKTERGFIRGDFKDRYGAACSIQKNSLATEDAIWLGMQEGTHIKNLDGSVDCLARMHLTREQVAILLPILQHFVETGNLPDATR
jgi:hypothetical protein